MSSSNDRDGYISAYERARDQLPGNKTDWIAALRARAANAFAETGFPTFRDEQWKYTNVAPIVRQTFALARPDRAVSLQMLSEVLFQGLPAYRLVFINGYFAAALSEVHALPPGAMAGSVASALDLGGDELETYLGTAEPGAQGFAALNTTFLVDGAYIRLARDVVLDRPIYVIYATTAAADTTLVQPRNVIVAESGSRATVIEHYVSLADARCLTNSVTELVAQAGARVEHYRVQQAGSKAFHVGALQVRQGQDTGFTSHAIDLGGLLVRNDLRSVIEAPGAECIMNGLYVADGRCHVDNHTEVDHAKPNGTSREFYKGVLDGRARAVFNGRVVVRPDAQRTDAEQMNHNLLLSDDAEVDTKPELEIYADDVKCSHGATVGQLDEDELFYLRSRAIDEGAARDLLTYAFAHDVLNRMRLAPIRSHLERSLTARLLRGRDIRELELV